MGGGELTRSLRKTLRVFGESGSPGKPLTTKEVAGSLDVSRRSTYDRLERLADRGFLETKKVGARGRIWWRPIETILDQDSLTEATSSADADVSPTDADVSSADSDASATDADASTTDADASATDADASPVDANPPSPANGGKFRQVVDHIDEVIWMSSPAKRDLLYVNPSYEEIWGRSRESLYEAPLSFLDAVHSADRDRVREALPKQRSGEYDEVYRIVRPDGSVRWIHDRATPIVDEDGEVYRLVGIAEDVTERMAREHELEQYETITQIASDVFVTIDDESRIRTVNPAVEDVFGYDPDDLIDEPLTTLMPDRFADAHRAGVVDYLETGERQLDWEYVELPGARADGDEVQLAVSFSEYEHGGEHYFTGIIRDITERKVRERNLERQHEELAALNSLNEVVREISDAVIEQSTREEIEQIVCERLVATGSYEFAWTCDVDPRTQSVDPRVEVGVDGYADDVTILTDSNRPAGQGPGGRAIRSKEMQTVQNVLEDPAFERWHDTAEEYGFRSLAAIPLVHEDTFYGLLNVYSERPDAFDDQEGVVISQLGETIGHAIAAVERKRALMSDEVVELEFRIPNVLDALGVESELAGTITFDDIVLVADDEYLVYGTATADAVDTVSAMRDAIASWNEVSFRDGDDGTSFEIRVSEPPLLSEVASRGGSIRESVVEGGDHHMTLHLPPSVSVRQIMDAVRESFPTAELVTRRQITRTDDLDADVERVLAAELTDRQRTALHAAYRSGFFDWPRETSGQEIAESLGVSSPTFHQHLRKAERKVFQSLLASSASETDSSAGSRF